MRWSYVGPANELIINKIIKQTSLYLTLTTLTVDAKKIKMSDNLNNRLFSNYAFMVSIGMKTLTSVTYF